MMRLGQSACSLALGLALLLVTSCATPQASSRSFKFETDTFSYRNELVWVYHYDENSVKTSVSRREPRPDYTQRCFVVSRAARQFFDHAVFDPSQPAVDAKAYRKLVQQVMGRSARKPSSESQRIVIPAYAGLRSFSVDWEQLLKDECGGPWRSYLQCGNWRMIIPFTRGQQERTAAKLAQQLESGRPQVAHVVRFPQLTINHAMLVYDSVESDKGRTYLVYDPNDNEHPVELVFDAAKREFFLRPNEYFAGGMVNVYPAYQGWCY